MIKQPSIITVDYEGVIRLFDVIEDNWKSGIILDKIPFGEMETKAIIFGYTGRKPVPNAYRMFILCSDRFRFNEPITVAKMFVNKRGYNMLKPAKEFYDSRRYPAIIKVYKDEPVFINNKEKNIIFATGFDGSLFEYGVFVMPNSKFSVGNFEYLYNGYSLILNNNNNEEVD